MQKLEAKDIKNIFDIIANIMEKNKQKLIELDSILGDGDLGLTMSKGFNKISEEFKSLGDFYDIGNLFLKAGMVIAETVPSTMGTLIGSGLINVGKHLKNKSEIGLQDFTILIESFTQGIMDRGKSKPGDKTIVDALYPAIIILKEEVLKNSTLKRGINLALDAAKKGAESTKNMVSKHGRAAYYQEKSIGKQDPGSEVGVLFLSAFADYINSH